MDEDLSVEFEVEQARERNYVESTMDEAINEDYDRDLDKEIRYLLEID
jgi:hypothetical protein